MKYLLIGKPIDHSLSPQIHNYFFEKTGHIYKKYEKLLVENLSKNIIDTFYKENIMGINITVPYKEDIIKHIYSTDILAKNIGSINTLKYTQNGYVGYNTDILGIQHTFLENGINIMDKNVLIIGAGGSGRTASFFSLNAMSITIANRTIKRAKTLKNDLKSYSDTEIYGIGLDDINKLKGINIIINTSTIGFLNSDDKSIIGDKFFENNDVDFVLDIIYNPMETNLLNIAKKNLVKCANGIDMLIYQAICAQEIWTGEKFTDIVRKNIKNDIKKMLIEANLV